MIELPDDSQNKLKAFTKPDTLLKIGDSVMMNVYVGQKDSIPKLGIIEKIYEKEKYNMLLCKFKSEKGNNHYYSCTIQLKDSLTLFS